MPGAIAIIIVLLLFPVAIVVGGLFASALLGFALQRNGEVRDGDTELAGLPD